MRKLLFISFLFCSLAGFGQIKLVQVTPSEYGTPGRNSDSSAIVFSGNLGFTGNSGTGTSGIPLIISGSTKFVFVNNTLHGSSWIDVSGFPWWTGNNTDGEAGTGSAGSSGILVKIAVDARGNPFTPITIVQGSYIQIGADDISGNYYIKHGTLSDTVFYAGVNQYGMGGDGTLGPTTLLAPTLMYSLPSGKRVIQMCSESATALLLNDGTVWTCGAAGVASYLGRTVTGSNYATFMQVTGFDDSIRQIVGGSQCGMVALSKNDSLWGFGPNAGYLGNASNPSYSTPHNLGDSIKRYIENGTTRTKITQISANMNCFHAIANDSSLWGWGDNGMGNIGNGVEANLASPGGSSSPWALDPSAVLILAQTHPVRVTNKHNFVNIPSGLLFALSFWAQDATGQWYVAGRNKGAMLPNGVIECTGDGGDLGNFYPNSWDIPYLTPINPYGVTSTIQQTCQGCHTGAVTANCHSCGATSGAAAIVVGGNSQTTSSLNYSLDWTTSTSTGGKITYYLLTQVSGPAATIDVPAASVNNIVFSGPGTYVFNGFVQDQGFSTGNQNVTVVVTSGGTDTIPTLSPSLGSLIKLPTSSATVSVSAVPHNGTTISSYSWAKTTGPGAFTITSPTAASTTVTGLVSGLYVFTVTVTDSHGNTNTATVTVVVHAASGTQYSFYFASAANGGSDANACTIGAPCLSISKMNTVAAARVAGDSVLFNASDTIYGQFLPGNNSSYGGAYGVPIWFGRYGSGANFVFTGFSTITGWTQEGATNIYKAPCPLCKTTLNLVTIDGLPVPMARYPNPGTYLTYNTTATDTLQVIPALTGTPIITNSWEVIRAGNFSWLVDSVASVSGDSVRRTGSVYSKAVNNYGLFFEKSHAFLDTTGEWFYDVSTGNLEVYMVGGPSAHVIKAATMDTVIYTHISEHDLTFDSLQVIGSNQQGFNSSEFFNGGRITWQNSNFDFHGGNGISNNSNLSPLPTMSVINCTFNHCYNDAIYSQGSLFGNYFGHNTFTNTGMMLGAGGSSFGDECAIYCTATNTVYEYNNISTSGYCGINFVGDSSYIRFNSIFHSCKWLDDGAALYTFRNSGGVHVWQWIYSNVLVNDITDVNNANEARPSGNISLVMGDYHDQQSSQITDSANTIVGFVGGGVNLNEVNQINIIWNTLYDNDSAGINIVGRSTPTSNVRLSHNIIGVTNPKEQLIHAFSTLNNLSSFFVSGSPDSNYYCSSSPLFSAVPSNGGYATLNLAGWRTQYADAHSQVFGTPDLFAANSTSTLLPLSLSQAYTDVNAINYSITTNINPFSSLVLFGGIAKDKIPLTFKFTRIFWKTKP